MSLFAATIVVSADIEIDDQCLTAERGSFWHPPFDRDEIAQHIAFNVLVNQLNLSQIDGFADLPDDLVKTSDIQYDVEVDDGE